MDKKIIEKIILVMAGGGMGYEYMVDPKMAMGVGGSVVAGMLYQKWFGGNRR